MEQERELELFCKSVTLHGFEAPYTNAVLTVPTIVPRISM